MASAVNFKIRTTEFDRTLKEYRKYSKRDLATIVNTKALFIARRAILETPKANKNQIARELGRMVKSGKNAGKLRLKSGSQHDAPLAALIINKRRGPGRGLYGSMMEEAIRQLLSARNRSIAFLKSGWIGAVRKLLPFADRGGPRQDRVAKEYGQAKGDATPARDNSVWKTKATITNSADSTHDKTGALIKYGGPALQRAFNAEEASMREYIERKLRESARQAGINPF